MLPPLGWSMGAEVHHYQLFGWSFAVVLEQVENLSNLPQPRRVVPLEKRKQGQTQLILTMPSGLGKLRRAVFALCS